tara:strand:+ start:775 stop:1284 length:510 start_codon:yes stop_codon:yes gene_type:complete
MQDSCAGNGYLAEGLGYRSIEPLRGRHQNPEGKVVNSNRAQSESTATADGHGHKALDIAREKRRLRQIRTRKLILGVVSLLTSILVLNALIGEQGVLSVMRARAERTTLEKVMDSLRKENYDLRQLADNLRTDPSTIERIARDDLGLIAPGEQVLIIGEPRNPQSLSPD